MKNVSNKHNNTVCNLTSRIVRKNTFTINGCKFWSPDYAPKKSRLSINFRDMVEGDTITINDIIITYVGKHKTTVGRRHILYDFDVIRKKL